MSISFSLQPNNLTGEPNQFRAVVQPAGTIDYNGIIDQILVHHSTITRFDILTVLDSFILILINMLLLGFNVTTPGFNFRVTNRGNFVGQNDSFTPGRNTVEVSISPGLQIRRGMQNAQVQKQESSERLPHLLGYLDMNSGDLNSRLTLGGMGQVGGHRLKFDPTDPAQGIFFSQRQRHAGRSDRQKRSLGVDLPGSGHTDAGRLQPGNASSNEQRDAR